MTSAARGRAVGVVLALVLASATLAGSATVPVQAGGTGASAHDHADHDGENTSHDHGAHADEAAAAAGVPTSGLELLAEHAEHEHGPSAEDDRRTIAQGFRRARPGSLCEGGYELVTAKGVRCSHGDDVELSGAPPLLGGSATDGTSRSSASVACVGDGVAGNRVQLMYVRRGNQGDRFATMKPKMIAWASTIDEIMVRSAQETGGVRRVRWVTDGSCTPTVLNVVLPNTVNTFSAMANALAASPFNYNAANRKYLIAAEMGDYCGLGETYPDDRPLAANYNNGNAPAMYASVSAMGGCWIDTVAAHELLHTLGAVQDTAPNATHYGHCTDEWDVMCYRDGPDTMALYYPCPKSHENLVDCNHDDYFSTNPPLDNYLRTHWNTAASTFLDAGEFLPLGVSATPQPGAATVTWDAPAFDGGSPITGYVVTASPGGASAAAGPAARSVVVPRLVDGVAVTFTVRAYNALGPSGVSLPSGPVVPTPLISTLGSFSSEAYPSGFGAAPDGTVYVPETTTGSILKYTAGGTKTTAAGGGLITNCPPVDGVAASTLDIQAADVAVHPTTGDLYYSDARCGRVRRVQGGLVTSVTTVAGLDPGPLAFAPDGTLYVSDPARGQVRKVVSAGNVPVVAGGAQPGFGGDGGSGTSALVGWVTGLATDTAGNVYIADETNRRVRRLTSAGTITTVLGTGSSDEGADGRPATQTAIGTPRGVAWSAGRLYVVAGASVRVVDTGGLVRTWVAYDVAQGDSGDGGPASLAQLQQPVDTEVAGGRVLVLDRDAHKVRRVEASPVVFPALPGAPTSFTATAAAQGAVLTWVPPSNGGSPLTGYKLYISPIGAVRDIAPDQSAIAVSSLSTDISHTFTLVAVNAVGDGPAAVSSPAQPFVGTLYSPFTSWDRFITQQYRDFVGRNPTSSELATDRDRLSGGIGSLESYIDKKAHGSPFGDTYGPVARLYFAYFLRAPDQSGLDHWREKYRSGTSLAAVSQAFASSSEFKTRYGSLSNRQFVATVYVNVLGRPGDAGGISYWTGQLDSGKKTRGSVMIGFSESSEYVRVRKHEIDAILIYRGMMGRVPTKAEFAHTVERLSDNPGELMDFISDLLLYPEYTTRADL